MAPRIKVDRTERRLQVRSTETRILSRRVNPSIHRNTRTVSISPRGNVKPAEIRYSDARLSNSERFHLEARSRPPPSRTRSASPSGQRAAHVPHVVYLSAAAPSIVTWVKRQTGRVVKPVGRGVGRALHLPISIVKSVGRAVGRAWRHTVRIVCHPSFIAATTIAIAYTAPNAIAYYNQPMAPILQEYTNQYRGGLGWLHADSPEQILGMDAPFWSRHIQPPLVMRSAARKAHTLWHPDKRAIHQHRVTGKLPPQSEFDQIANRTWYARDRFYFRQPFLTNGLLDDYVNTTMPGDPLPRVREGCVCGVQMAVTSALWHTLVPYWKHPSLPSTAEELALYCPCTLKKGIERQWRGHHALPPPSFFYYQGNDTPFWLDWWYGSDCVRVSKNIPEDEFRDAVKDGWLNTTWYTEEVINTGLYFDREEGEADRLAPKEKDDYIL